MSTPHGYKPQQGDVILVRATVSRVTAPVEPGDPVRIAVRTTNDRVVRCEIGDIEKVEAFTIAEGTRVRWWDANPGIGPASFVYGTVLAIEENDDAEKRPHHDNLWIKEEGHWPRLTKFRKDVERA